MRRGPDQDQRTGQASAKDVTQCSNHAANALPIVAQFIENYHKRGMHPAPVPWWGYEFAM